MNHGFINTPTQGDIERLERRIRRLEDLLLSALIRLAGRDALSPEAQAMLADLPAKREAGE